MDTSTTVLVEKRFGIQCNHCHTRLVSVSRHHFNACSCFENKIGNKGVAIDGGGEYYRMLGNHEDYETLFGDWVVDRKTYKLLAYTPQPLPEKTDET